MSKLINPRPIRMWIHGKCFNIRKFDQKSQQKFQDDNDVVKEEILFENFHTISESSGKFLTKFRLPKLYYIKLQNMPDFSIDELSNKAGTDIIFPQAGQDGEIVVHSDSKEKLFKVVDEIHSVVAEIRRRNVPLQFVCIPCVSKNVQERFENLKKEVLELGVEGIHESIFQCPKKLHLTVNVFVLMDDAEKIEAMNSLNDYKKEVLDPLFERVGPLKIDIGGLDFMDHNIKKVNVLYAKAKIANESEEHSLQSIVNGLSKYFYDRGLTKECQESVKLHMTIMNTKYRKIPGSPKRKRRRLSFDATKIIEKYKDYLFGQCDFDSIHLSHISLKGEDGFYKPISIAKMGVS